MITTFECPHCGTTDPQNAYYYDGLFGYEAIVCMKCKGYSDHEGDHTSDEWSCDLIKEMSEEESTICSTCNGSGEGMWDGSTCRTCKGSGEVPK